MKEDYSALKTKLRYFEIETHLFRPLDMKAVPFFKTSRTDNAAM
jgi:hypothetical protein